jgi:hypothetical protein
MSDLTKCNRCTLDEMQRRAAARGAEVIVEVEHAAQDMAGWISARYSDDDEPSAYFLSLPEACACS